MTISNSMTVLVELANQQHEIEEQIIQKEAELKQLKQQLAVVAEDHLPSLMEELDMDRFETKDGLVVDVKETIHAHISQANKAAAYTWLRDNGHGSLIKVRTTEGVHHSTLKSLVNELVADGEDFPQEEFGVYRQRKAKIEFK